MSIVYMIRAEITEDKESSFENRVEVGHGGEVQPGNFTDHAGIDLAAVMEKFPAGDEILAKAITSLDTPTGNLPVVEAWDLLVEAADNYLKTCGKGG